MRLLAKFTKRRVLAALLCLSIIASLLGSPLARRVRVASQWLLVPYGDAGMYVTNAVRTSVGRPKVITEADVRRLESDREMLEGYVAQLQAEVADLKRQLPEIKRIFGQIPRTEFPYELIPARVVARDSMPYGSTGVVSFRSAYEVPAGARVTTRRLQTDLPKALPENLSALTGSALVGRVTQTWAFGASLQLVSDKAFRVHGRVHRIIRDRQNPRMIKVIEQGKARSEPLKDGRDGNNDPVPVFAEGDGQGLIAREISENYGILPGDKLVTIKDEYLPDRIVIGDVSEVIKDAEHPGFVTLRIRPAADLERLRFVYIVLPIAMGPEN